MSSTARILIIDTNRERLAALQRGLTDAGYSNVAAVPSGSFALTMLERDRPDLIVCRVRIADIDGYELCSIVRSDPALRGVLFLLLAGEGEDVPGAAFEAGADRFLVGDFTIATIVAEVQTLLPQAVEPPVAPALARIKTAHDLRGSLGVMDVADLTQAIALGGKTGHLMLTVGGRQGVIAFERGRVVHAEVDDRLGEHAFAALVAAGHRDAEGTFGFIPLDRRAPNLPRTIECSVEQLLLHAAAEMDEGRVAR
jgi:DNA-binding response OmpR family regulator